MSFVEIHDLTKSYEGGFSLNNISFNLEKGETLTLMGPSGSGKTSLLRNICGLDYPDSGNIIIDSVDLTRVSAGKRNIGMIFQDLALFPHMSVYDNIAYGPRASRESESEVRSKVDSLSEMLRISDLLDRLPSGISGGQRQRVALARSVASSPALLLLDEPMSSLDTPLRSIVRGEIKAFAKETGLTMIYVTHDHHEGLYMANTAGVLFDGKLERVDSPENLFNHPGNERTARFFGYNVIMLEERNIAFYPSDVVVDSGNPDFSGVLQSAGFEGEFDRAHIMLETGELVQAWFPPGQLGRGLSPGSVIPLRIGRKFELDG